MPQPANLPKVTGAIAPGNAVNQKKLGRGSEAMSHEKVVGQKYHVVVTQSIAHAKPVHLNYRCEGNDFFQVTLRQKT